jgi:hypothetical protein
MTSEMVEKQGEKQEVLVPHIGVSRNIHQKMNHL